MKNTTVWLTFFHETDLTNIFYVLQWRFSFLTLCGNIFFFITCNLLFHLDSISGYNWRPKSSPNLAYTVSGFLQKIWTN